MLYTSHWQEQKHRGTKGSKEHERKENASNWAAAGLLAEAAASGSTASSREKPFNHSHRTTTFSSR